MIEMLIPRIRHLGKPFGLGGTRVRDGGSVNGFEWEKGHWGEEILFSSGRPFPCTSSLSRSRLLTGLGDGQ